MSKLLALEYYENRTPQTYRLEHSIIGMAKFYACHTNANIGMAVSIGMAAVIHSCYVPVPLLPSFNCPIDRETTQKLQIELVCDGYTYSVSSATSPFGRALSTSYSLSVVTMCLSCTVSKSCKSWRVAS